MSDHFSLSEDEINTKLNDLTKIINSFSNLSKEKTESAIEEAMDLSRRIEKILNQMKQECSTLSASDQISMKLRNYNSEYEMLRTRINKMEEEYIIYKSQTAMSSQNPNIVITQNKEKVNENNIEINVSFDKNLNLELMKHYTSNEDVSKYHNEIKINNDQHKKRTIILITIIILLVIALILTIIIYSNK